MAREFPFEKCRSSSVGLFSWIGVVAGRNWGLVFVLAHIVCAMANLKSEKFKRRQRHEVSFGSRELAAG